MFTLLAWQEEGWSKKGEIRLLTCFIWVNSDSLFGEVCIDRSSDKPSRVSEAKQSCDADDLSEQEALQSVC